LQNTVSCRPLRRRRDLSKPALDPKRTSDIGNRGIDSAADAAVAEDDEVRVDVESIEFVDQDALTDRLWVGETAAEQGRLTRFQDL
jgi:hypothetical protein